MAIILPIATKFNDSGIKKAQSSFGSMGSSIKKLVGVAAGAAAIGMAIRGIGESVKAAASDAKAQKILADQLRRTTNATKEQIAASEQFVTSLSLQTGVLDDTLRPALTNAVRGTGSLAEGQKLLKIALDGAAASGKPVETVMNALIKANNGNTTALYKLAPELKKTKGGLDQYAASVRGAAEASANPFDRFKVALSEMQESIGGALLPVINQLAVALLPIIQQLGPILGAILEQLAPLFIMVGEAIKPLFEALKPLFAVFGLIIGVVVKLVQMVMPTLIKIIQALVPVITPFIDALMQIVQALFPIIPLVLDLVLSLLPLITTILPPLTELLVALVPIVVAFVQAFTTGLQPVIGIVSTLVKYISGGLIVAINLVVAVVKNLTPVFQTVFGGIGKFIKTIFDGVANAVKNVLNFIIDGLNTAIDGLNLALQGLETVTGGAVKLRIDKIPRLAEGGIVMPSPGGSIVNVAEAGQPEAIIPLNKMNGLGGGTFNITVNAGAGANGAQIGTEIVNAIKAYERSNGKGWRS